MQWSYREEACILSCMKTKLEQLDIRLTNILLKCGYPRNQMDTRKVEAMFSTRKDSEMKYYMREQPLTLIYQALLKKTKVHKRWSLAYYKSSRNPQLCMSQTP